MYIVKLANSPFPPLVKRKAVLPSYGLNVTVLLKLIMQQK